MCYTLLNEWLYLISAFFTACRLQLLNMLNFTDDYFLRRHIWYRWLWEWHPRVKTHTYKHTRDTMTRNGRIKPTSFWRWSISCLLVFQFPLFLLDHLICISFHNLMITVLHRHNSVANRGGHRPLLSGWNMLFRGPLVELGLELQVFVACYSTVSTRKRKKPEPVGVDHQWEEREEREGEAN